MYIIETTRLGLRNWTDSDTAKFAEMNRDPKVMEFFPKLLSEEETLEMVQKINTHIVDNGFGLWATEIKATKEFIGFVGLSIPRFQTDFTPCVEVGWRLAYNYWGKGYAQEAARECLNYGFKRLGLKRIVSFTSIFNERSMNVMKRIGMSYVKEFENPNVELGHKLRRHVLYVKNHEE
ncbi:GNAT family N-acetyltransferase [Desulfosporosinus sp. PR]|uniref:GNAT family N-acetyltransferase n=1 Tax=Candidatus Desulfosporosinus nitrosoreducens TaxID=3401928 RepID=UPI0027FF6174|nr:GNAT family N-acetyltransferase [Desulfosporosinus sp. PR]MDQ7092637.1 GNAT family N-acetyltransferase [Desulfosporosinus sp. PR]